LTARSGKALKMCEPTNTLMAPSAAELHKKNKKIKTNYMSNKRCYLDISIHQRILKTLYHGVHKYFINDSENSALPSHIKNILK